MKALGKKREALQCPIIELLGCSSIYGIPNTHRTHMITQQRHTMQFLTWGVTKMLVGLTFQRVPPRPMT